MLALAFLLSFNGSISRQEQGSSGLETGTFPNCPGDFPCKALLRCFGDISSHPGGKTLGVSINGGTQKWMGYSGAYENG